MGFAFGMAKALVSALLVVSCLTVEANLPVSHHPPPPPTYSPVPAHPPVHPPPKPYTPPPKPATPPPKPHTPPPKPYTPPPKPATPPPKPHTPPPKPYTPPPHPAPKPATPPPKPYTPPPKPAPKPATPPPKPYTPPPKPATPPPKPYAPPPKPHTPPPKPYTPPAKPPVHPPYIPQPRKLVAVQGVVYCKSCKYAGVDTLLNATEVAGAIVRLQCRNTKYSLFATAKTDKHGYFLIRPNFLTTYGVHKCKVSLLYSPLPYCRKPSILHGGDKGGVLRPELKSDAKLPFVLYSAGPFAFEPKKCPY